ncbi:MAG: molybdenum cofactor biosynthesis protein B [Pseudomonadales bacterium]
MTVTTNDEQTLAIAVITVSDTRTPENDTSGDYLASAAEAAGHRVLSRAIVKDDIYQLRACASQLIANPDIKVVLMTGGTGFSGRDSTPEAMEPLFDKTIDGFGELFRYLSFKEIGSSTVQSRAFAGLANDTAIFCVPGSTGACKTAWSGILQEQLDARHKPCNFVGVLKTRTQIVSP